MFVSRGAHMIRWRRISSISCSSTLTISRSDLTICRLLMLPIPPRPLSSVRFHRSHILRPGQLRMSHLPAGLLSAVCRLCGLKFCPRRRHTDVLLLFFLLLLTTRRPRSPTARARNMFFVGIARISLHRRPSPIAYRCRYRGGHGSRRAGAGSDTRSIGCASRMSIPAMLADVEGQPDDERYGNDSAQATTDANADFGAEGQTSFGLDDVLHAVFEREGQGEDFI